MASAVPPNRSNTPELLGSPSLPKVKPTEGLVGSVRDNVTLCITALSTRIVKVCCIMLCVSFTVVYHVIYTYIYYIYVYQVLYHIYPCVSYHCIRLRTVVYSCVSFTIVHDGVSFNILFGCIRWCLYIVVYNLPLCMVVCGCVSLCIIYHCVWWCVVVYHCV